jgi:hypothetical protein
MATIINLEDERAVRTARSQHGKGAREALIAMALALPYPVEQWQAELWADGMLLAMSAVGIRFEPDPIKGEK